jgi:hypothetical protein
MSLFHRQAFDPDLPIKTERHRRVFRYYEIAYTLNDLCAGLLFVVGSVLFFFAETTTTATWLFLIGSVSFTIRPAIKLLREFHLTQLPVD